MAVAATARGVTAVHRWRLTACAMATVLVAACSGDSPSSPPPDTPPPPANGPPSPPPSPTGTTWYVDQISGSDANPGTSPDAPLKNVPGMNGASAHTGGKAFSPGDLVYLARDATWPVGSGSDGCFVLTGGVKYVGDEWSPRGIGGRARLRATGRCEAGGIRFVADHPTFATWVEGLEYNGNNQVGSGIDMNLRFASNDLTGAVKRVEDVYLHDMAGNGGAGSFSYGIALRGRDNHPLANVEIIGSVPAGTPGGCEIFRPAREGIAIYPDDGGTVTNILVRGCEVHGIRTDPSYGEGHGIGPKGDVRNGVIEYNYVHDVNSSAIFVTGYSSGAPTGLVIRHNILHTQDNPGGRGTLRIYSAGSAESIDVYGNIFLANATSAGLDLSSHTGPLTLRVYNNTFYNSWVNFSGEGPGNEISFRNNIVQAPGNAAPIRNEAAVTMSHNATYAESDGNLAGFKNPAALPSGFAGTSPDWIPDADGLSVEAGPVIDAGIDLGEPYSRSINAVTRMGAWDLGAYELGGAGQQGAIPVAADEPPAARRSALHRLGPEASRPARSEASPSVTAALPAPPDTVCAATSPERCYQTDTVMTGLGEPGTIASLPDGRLLLVEREARVLIADASTATVAYEVDTVHAPGERIIGVALDPDFARSHILYLGIVTPGWQGDDTLRVERLREVNGVLGEPAAIVANLTTAGRAASLAIGPDGDLYLGVGAIQAGGVLRFTTSGRSHGVGAAGPGLVGMRWAPAGLEWDANRLWATGASHAGASIEILTLDARWQPAARQGVPIPWSTEADGLRSLRLAAADEAGEGLVFLLSVRPPALLVAPWTRSTDGGDIIGDPHPVSFGDFQPVAMTAPGDGTLLVAARPTASTGEADALLLRLRPLASRPAGDR